ncbi:glycosyltransferase [Pilimelia columellifera]|uniref:Glycosyltransferase n=1 Tax=Pilimelia columellifera subsp. columellifera TaxID=706583 RepID=A0ABN3NC39_9ACTN
MNILLWHMHAAWTSSLVQGKHRYLIPVTPDRGPFGRGRARTYDWPDTVEERTPAQLADDDIDVVIAQSPEEVELATRWIGRRVGRDIPLVYVEHNTPKGAVPDSRHPMADRDDVVVAHVTHFNAAFWDTGATRCTVIEHGIQTPVPRWTGELDRIGVAINEPVRRWRTTGTDLLPRFAAVAPVDVFGIDAAALPERLGLPGEAVVGHDDPPQAAMHAAMARRRLYLHPHRWTSLGLSLLEAMAMGMPAVVFATTDAIAAVPPQAGVLSTNLDELVDGARWLVEDASAAARVGRKAAEAVRARYGVDRFLADWDRLLEEATCG